MRSYPKYFAGLVVVSMTCLSAVEIVSDDFEGGALDANWDVASQATIATGTGAEASANFAALSSIGSGDILGSVIANGTSDLEFEFFVRIRDTGTRRFNVMVSTAQALAPAGAAVNIRYQNGGWAAFSGGWQALGNLGALTGEAWHRVRITCKGWGSAGATYDVELSDAGGTSFTSSEIGLSHYQDGDPNTTLAGSVVFTSNWGASPGYDVDNVAVNTLVAAVDDPNISIVSGDPFAGLMLDADPPVQTGDVLIENTGSANDLIIANTSAISGSAASSFSIATALPVTIAPGANATIQVDFDADGGNGTYSANLSVDSNDVSTPTVNVPMSVFVPSADGNQFGNSNFEEDTMALPKWTSAQGAALAIPGFAPASITAASIPGGSDLFQIVQGESEWYSDFYLKVQDSGSRAFNLVIAAGAGVSVNLRLQGSGEFGTWDTFKEGEGYGGMHALPGLVAGETYLMRVIGKDWGGATPTYDLQLSNPGSNILVHEVTGIDRFRGTALTPPGGPVQVTFSSEFGGNPGFEIDDASFINGAAPPLSGNAPLSIRNYAFDETTSTVSFDWNANIGTEYFIYVSTDLQTWTEIEDRNATNQIETYIETGAQIGPRFYRVQDFAE